MSMSVTRLWNHLMGMNEARRVVFIRDVFELSSKKCQKKYGGDSFEFYSEMANFLIDKVNFLEFAYGPIQRVIVSPGCLANNKNESYWKDEDEVFYEPCTWEDIKEEAKLLGYITMTLPSKL